MHERTWFWLRYTQSGFTINDPLDIIMWIVCQFHENSDIELHSKPVFCLKPLSESLEQSICIVCIWIGHFSIHSHFYQSLTAFKVLQHLEYSRTSCFYLLCDEQWGTVGLQWESRGREFETNLPPTQPRAYWGANPAYLSPPAKIDYSTTLLRYPIIQNKTDQTTYYSCCYYHLSQIHLYFMTPLTFYCHTNPQYFSHLGSRSHLQNTFVTQSTMIWKQDNMSTKGTWHRRYYFSHFSSKWQFLAAGDSTLTPDTTRLTSVNTRLLQAGPYRPMTGA